MAYSAINRDIAPASESTGIYVPVVMPSPKIRATRRVGTVKAYSPLKTYGLVAAAGRDGDAVFCIDDVAAADRPRLDRGGSVSFEIVQGPDGCTAKRIKRDATTLPPPPDDAMMLKGWR
jgi:cold shock CspA family protein